MFFEHEVAVAKIGRKRVFVVYGFDDFFFRSAVSLSSVSKKKVSRNA
jgi:hypothetical protein